MRSFSAGKCFAVNTFSTSTFAFTAHFVAFAVFLFVIGARFWAEIKSYHPFAIPTQSVWFTMIHQQRNIIINYRWAYQALYERRKRSTTFSGARSTFRNTHFLFEVCRHGSFRKFVEQPPNQTRALASGRAKRDKIRIEEWYTREHLLAYAQHV